MSSRSLLNPSTGEVVQTAIDRAQRAASDLVPSDVTGRMYGTAAVAAVALVGAIVSFTVPSFGAVVGGVVLLVIFAIMTLWWLYYVSVRSGGNGSRGSDAAAAYRASSAAGGITFVAGPLAESQSID